MPTETREFVYSEKPSALKELFLEKNLDKTKKKLKIIEIGGGYGRDAVFLSRWGDVVIVEKNVDARTLFNDFRRRYIFEHRNNFENIRFVLSDILDETIPIILKEKFDLICSYNVLHLFGRNEVKKLLTNSWNLLAENGHMLHIFVSNKDGLRKNKEGVFIHKLSKKTWESLLESAGMKFVSYEYRIVNEFHHNNLHSHIMCCLYCQKI